MDGCYVYGKTSDLGRCRRISESELPTSCHEKWERCKIRKERSGTLYKEYKRICGPKGDPRSLWDVDCTKIPKDMVLETAVRADKCIQARRKWIDECVDPRCQDAVHERAIDHMKKIRESCWARLIPIEDVRDIPAIVPKSTTRKPRALRKITLRDKDDPFKILTRLAKRGGNLSVVEFEDNIHVKLQLPNGISYVGQGSGPSEAYAKLLTTIADLNWSRDLKYRKRIERIVSRSEPETVRTIALSSASQDFKRKKILQIFAQEKDGVLVSDKGGHLFFVSMVMANGRTYTGVGLTENNATKKLIGIIAQLFFKNFRTILYKRLLGLPAWKGTRRVKLEGIESPLQFIKRFGTKLGTQLKEIQQGDRHYAALYKNLSSSYAGMGATKAEAIENLLWAIILLNWPNQRYISQIDTKLKTTFSSWEL